MRDAFLHHGRYAHSVIPIAPVETWATYVLTMAIFMLSSTINECNMEILVCVSMIYVLSYS